MRRIDYVLRDAMNEYWPPELFRTVLRSMERAGIDLFEEQPASWRDC